MKEFKEMPSVEETFKLVPILRNKIAELTTDMDRTEKNLEAREAEIKDLGNRYDGEIKNLKEKLTTLTGDFNELQEDFLFKEGSL